VFVSATATAVRPGQGGTSLATEAEHVGREHLLEDLLTKTIKEKNYERHQQQSVKEQYECVVHESHTKARRPVNSWSSLSLASTATSAS